MSHSFFTPRKQSLKYRMRVHDGTRLCIGQVFYYTYSDFSFHLLGCIHKCTYFGIPINIIYIFLLYFYFFFWRTPIYIIYIYIYMFYDFVSCTFSCGMLKHQKKKKIAISPLVVEVRGIFLLMSIKLSIFVKKYLLTNMNESGKIWIFISKLQKFVEIFCIKLDFIWKIFFLFLVYLHIYPIFHSWIHQTIF